MGYSTRWIYNNADSLPFTIRQKSGRLRFSKRGLENICETTGRKSEWHKRTNKGTFHTLRGVIKAGMLHACEARPEEGAKHKILIDFRAENTPRDLSVRLPLWFLIVRESATWSSRL
jgi:hypothetical protein